MRISGASYLVYCARRQRTTIQDTNGWKKVYPSTYHIRSMVRYWCHGASSFCRCCFLGGWKGTVFMVDGIVGASMQEGCRCSSMMYRREQVGLELKLLRNEVRYSGTLEYYNSCYGNLPGDVRMRRILKARREPSSSFCAVHSHGCDAEGRGVSVVSRLRCQPYLSVPSNLSLSHAEADPWGFPSQPDRAHMFLTKMQAT